MGTALDHISGTDVSRDSLEVLGSILEECLHEQLMLRRRPITRLTRDVALGTANLLVGLGRKIVITGGGYFGREPAPCSGDLLRSLCDLGFRGERGRGSRGRLARDDGDCGRGVDEMEAVSHWGKVLHEWVRIMVMVVVRVVGT